uniref:Rho GDP dissociation inhibitor beta n=1 Tax=Catharus ustulatus TaxID=91951 RepID=A0A8C3XWQ2_CATUS
MTEKTQEPHVEDDDDELDGKLNYKPPPQKTLQELQELDKDDESLAKYKKSLLGDGPVVVDPTAPNVVVTRLTLVCDSAPGPITMDLTGRHSSALGHKGEQAKGLACSSLKESLSLGCYSGF